jgi:hypothetical protein
VDAGNGRGGKVDLGRRSVDDHDARRNRVGTTIVASSAGLLSEMAAGDIFEAPASSAMPRRFFGRASTHSDTFFLG